MRFSLLFEFVLLVCLLVPTGSARAQDAASAKTFLQSMYARYSRNSPGVEVAGPHAARFLHTSLIALIRKDARAVGPGEVGVLDSDPLCACQDWDGIFDLRIDMRQAKADHAEALVSFSVFKNAKPQHRSSLVITLATEKGAWRVWNVVDRSDPKFNFDLRRELQKEISSLRTTKHGGAATGPQ
jgi:hypothetical protein